MVFVRQRQSAANYGVNCGFCDKHGSCATRITSLPKLGSSRRVTKCGFQVARIGEASHPCSSAPKRFLAFNNVEDSVEAPNCDAHHNGGRLT